MVLLCSSFFFYACYGIPYLPYLIALIFLTYLFAVLISKQKKKTRKKYFLLSLITISGYWLFLKVANLISADVAFYTPIGISFFTLEAISYISDVYQHRSTVQKNFFKLALYLSFFPTITSGPIKKADAFFKELEENQPVTANTLQNGLLLFLKGLFLKAVISDHLSLYTSYIYANSEVRGVSILLAFLLYSFQLYSDFSGYTDMARGSAMMLGITIPENFEQPYFAASVKDFWHRWHQSLSTWLKDYIYIPLGGSHCSKSRKYANVILTFLFSGFWHGNGLHYIVWGLLHGCAQIIESYVPVHHKKSGQVVTFLFVTFAWIFFGAGSLSNAFSLLSRSVSFSADLTGLTECGLTALDWGITVLGLGMLFLMDYAREKRHKELWECYPTVIRKYILLWILVLLTVLSLDGSGGEFMYMQF